MREIGRIFDKAKIRAIDAFVDILGVSSSFDRFMKFEKKFGFMYTRIKGKLALGYALNIRRPRSFNEKSIHRRLFSRDPVWPVVTDKVLVRKWLAEKGLDRGFEFVPMPYVIEEIDEFDFAQIVEPVVIKAAWASGLNLFVRNPSAEDWESIKMKLKKWKEMVYFPKRLVWPETQMKRVFAVEKMYSNAPGGMLDDYKFYVFHGRVELLQVISGRGGDIRYDHYDGALNRIHHVSRHSKKVGEGILDPKVEDMIPLVERIGAEFDFARVDMYLLNGQIWFGEITQCPANGFAAFSPSSFDFELGEKWKYDYSKIYKGFVGKEILMAGDPGVA